MASEMSLAAVAEAPAAAELIERKIHWIRGQKVMLSAVKRNIDRFPADFMFQLTAGEFENLKSQNVISSWGGVRRATPYAFTEQGVAMLSSVLRSARAIHVNISIMRTFVKLRNAMAAHKDFAHQIAELERKYSEHDESIQMIFRAIRDLLEPEPCPPKRRIGFES